MFLTAERPHTNTYPVEVSGWDKSHSFFVEKCDLEWSEETGKRIVLTRLLTSGSMIFLRLLQPISPERSLPVAYHASSLGMTPEGKQWFRLSQIHPTGSSGTGSK